jgi:hypothetical protein
MAKAYFPPHVLKPNAVGEIPRYFAFLDIETKGAIVADDVVAQRFHLGYLATVRRPLCVTDPWPAHYVYLDSLATLYDAIEAAVPPRSSMYLYAHNAQFDAQAGDLIRGLSRRGWKLGFLITEPHKFMMRWSKPGRHVWILDSANLFPLPLSKLAESLGMVKGQVDFDTVSDPELAEYCKNDVAILMEALRQWVCFVHQQNLGKFSLTLASQAFAAYRHRFMPAPIYIHTRKPVVDIERLSYFGGRVECFRLGELPEQAYYMLDVNSLYPHVMQAGEFPTKYAGIYVRPPLSLLSLFVQNYTVAAEVRVETAVPLVPYRTAKDLLWPTGEFATTLIGDELVEALRCGIVKEVERVVCYDRAPIFREYVNELYPKRRLFESEGNPAFAFFCKLLLNSLYGKFGQRARGWKKIGDCEPDRIEFTRWLDADHKAYSVRYLGGIVEALMDLGNSRNTFVAIAASVSAAARMHLWRLMQTVPSGHLYYVDTDSLLVDQTGLDALRGQISETGELGKLKVQGEATHVVIRGPKSYIFGDTVKQKGVPAAALQTGPNTWEYTQWQSLDGSVHDGVSGEVRQRKVVKQLATHYRKGTVNEEGRVAPFVLSEPLPLASALLQQLSWLLPLSDAFSRLRQAISPAQ